MGKAMGKAASFEADDNEAIRANFGVRTEGHKPASFETSTTEDIRFAGTKRDHNAKLVAISKIIAKEQVRKDFDEEKLQELAHSLKTVGQKTPILVYWSDEDKSYVIIAGERRYRAAKMAGLSELSCQVHPYKPTEEQIVELQFVENAIRSDLNPIEEAETYRRLSELKGYSANQLAARIGKNQSTITRALSLLKLPPAMQAKIAKGLIPASVGREMLKLPSEEEQERMAAKYLAGEITTTQAQAETKSKGKNGPSKISKKWTQDGIGIVVSYGRGVSLSDIAEALEERARLLRNDGRGKKVA